jgi:hypothetical protein
MLEEPCTIKSVAMNTLPENTCVPKKVLLPVVAKLPVLLSKFDKRAILEAVIELMFVIEMSTLADLLSKFNILGEKDAVAVFKDVNISTTCDEPETVPVGKFDIVCAEPLTTPVGKELIKLILPLLRVSVVTIVCADIVLVVCAVSSTKKIEPVPT